MSPSLPPVFDACFHVHESTTLLCSDSLISSRKPSYTCLNSANSLEAGAVGAVRGVCISSATQHQLVAEELQRRRCSVDKQKMLVIYSSGRLFLALAPLLISLRLIPGSHWALKFIISPSCSHSVAHSCVCVCFIALALLIQDTDNYNVHKYGRICHSRYFLFSIMEKILAHHTVTGSSCLSLGVDRPQTKGVHTHSKSHTQTFTKKKNK